LAAGSGECLDRVLVWLVIAVAAVLAFRRIGDFDTWWHLASGRWIVAHGTIPHHDTLSFTVPDHPWINLQWLFDVMIYGLYRVGGAPLLVVFSCAGFTAAVWLLLRGMRLSLGSVAAVLLAAWALVVVQERFVLRPEVLSFFYLTALNLLLATRGRDDGRRLWMAVPLMLVWVNSHALFIVGLFCLLWTCAATFLAQAHVLPRFWRESTAMSRSGRRRLLGVSAAATAVTLLNPYWVRGALFPFELFSRIDGSNPAFASIGEFIRPFSGFFPTLAIGAYQVYFYFALLVLASSAVLAARPAWIARRREDAGRLPGLPRGADRFDLAGAGIVLALAYLSLQARRNTGLFVIGAGPFVAQEAAVLIARLPQWRGGWFAALHLLTSGVLACAAVAMIAWTATNGFYRWDNRTVEFGSGVLDVNFPIEASRFARRLGLKPKLYNDLTAGGYLTWSSPVDGGVFIDGRLEVYNADFFSEYLRGLGDFRRWAAEADRYKINTAILFHRWGNRRSLVRHLAAAGSGWALIYYDETAAVFVRRAGNEGKIREAARLFPTYTERVWRRLRDHRAWWQWPVGDAHGAVAYGQMLSAIGRRDAAADAFGLAIDNGVARSVQIGLYTWLARFHARRGENEQALLDVRAGLAIDPDNQILRDGLMRLGG